MQMLLTATPLLCCLPYKRCQSPHVTALFRAHGHDMAWPAAKAAPTGANFRQSSLVILGASSGRGVEPVS